MIRNFLDRRRIRRIFSRFLSLPQIDDLISDNKSVTDLSRLRNADIGYVLAMVRGETPGQISARMGQTSDLANRFGGITDCMVSGLIVVTFGTAPYSVDSAGIRSDFVTAFDKELGNDGKLVHGSASACCGNIGSSSRMANSFILPEFSDALARLCALPFGQKVELKLT